jgi:hypothetical protein
MSLTQNQIHLLSSLKNVAKEQLENNILTDEELSAIGASLSGLIGELAACQVLNLQWCPSTGYVQEKEASDTKSRREDDPPQKKSGKDELGGSGAVNSTLAS